MKLLYLITLTKPKRLVLKSITRMSYPILAEEYPWKVGDIVNVLELLKEFDENMVLVWESDGKEIQEHREDKFVTILS